MTLRYIAVFCAFGLAFPAASQQRQAERPEALSRLVNCRPIANTDERLACFDREVAALDAAHSAQELVVVDRQQLRSTRRTLFGLTLPNLGIFGDDEREEEARQIEAPIRTATQDGNRKWSFTLEDGARWVQTDTRQLAIDPRPGHMIRIRRAAMGSYLANVNGQVAMRVQRVR